MAQFEVTRSTTASTPLRRFRFECLDCGTVYEGLSATGLTRATILHTGPSRGHGTIEGRWIDINGAEYDPSLWFEIPKSTDDDDAETLARAIEIVGRR